MGKADLCIRNEAIEPLEVGRPLLVILLRRAESQCGRKHGMLALRCSVLHSGTWRPASVEGVDETFCCRSHVGLDIRVHHGRCWGQIVAAVVCEYAGAQVFWHVNEETRKAARLSTLLRS